MDVSWITEAEVKRALECLRRAESLGDSPLMRLPALGRDLRQAGEAVTPERLEVALAALLTDLIWEHLERCRAAAAYLHECVTLRVKLDEPLGAVEALEGIACLAMDTDSATSAACLLGAAAGQRENLGAPLPPGEQSVVEVTAAACRAALGDAAYDAAYAVGQAMTLDEAVAVALGEATRMHPPSSSLQGESG